MFISRTLGALAVIAFAQIAIADPLPSWNDTDTRTRIIAFVGDVSDPASDNFVPAADRIAVFDNDGTLWGEQHAGLCGLADRRHGQRLGARVR